jgi:uncharacterized protein (DUF1501 family)
MKRDLSNTGRRDVLKMLGVASALGISVTMCPKSLLASTGSTNRTFVVIKLSGGNDSLNTVIPYTETLYSQFRPTLAIPTSAMSWRDQRFGFHPSLAPLVPSWTKDGDMAILLGLGYPNPSDSHFHSSDIWDTGVPSDVTPDEGWIASYFDQVPNSHKLPADAVMTGNYPPGPLAGQNIRAVVSTPSANKEMHASTLANVSKFAAGNPVYGSLYNDQLNLDAASASFAKLTGFQQSPNTSFNSSLLDQLNYTAYLIKQNLGVPVITLSQSSYDTHHNQATAHATLLSDLANGLVSFKSILQAAGLWNNVMVMTYAEFGRSAIENSTQGTDHGWGSTHFVMGGAIKGGYYGNQNSLASINLNAPIKAPAYTIDYRSVYASVIQNWFGSTAAISSNVLGGVFSTIGMFK